MQVTLTGKCPKCREPVALHEHLPAVLPYEPGARVEFNRTLYVVTEVAEAPAGMHIGELSVKYALVPLEVPNARVR